MSDIVIVIFLLVSIAAALLAVTPRLSERLLRVRSRHLSQSLAHRMEEEWLAEVRAISSRPTKLAFALALFFTHRNAFGVPSEDFMNETHDHARSVFIVLGGWKSLLIIPTVVFALAAYGMSFLLPVRYASEALIIASRADVPANVAPGLSRGTPSQQLTGTRQLLLSRTSLVTLIRKFNLNDSEKSSRTIDQRVQQIRDGVTITTDPEYEKSGNSAFTLRFVGTNPKTAQQIASGLVTLFLEQSSQIREQETSSTLRFLQVQLDQLAKRLTEKSELLSRERTGKGEAVVHALDYEMLQSTYKAVFTKLEEERMTEILETPRRQFVVVDPPSLPEHPVGPDGKTLAAFGALGGCLFGVMTIGGLSRRRRRVLA